MPGTINNEYGKIVITDELIASIAGLAATENSGIVGMKSKSATDTFLQLVGSENLRRGVKVTTIEDGKQVDIDLYVTLLYGIPLPAVANNIIEHVRYKVTEMTGIEVRRVNIFVEAIYIDKE